MRITDIKISNFRSLEEIEMDGLSNFNVIIGKNSSGKSNILEGLAFVFDNFAMTGGNTPGLTDYTWHDRRTRVPVSFIITVELDDSELSDVFPAELIEAFNNSPRQHDRVLSFCRKLVDTQGNWKTGFLRWNGLTLVSEDKQATAEELTSELQKRMTKLAKSFSYTITPQVLSTIYTKIAEKLRGKFKLIAAVRDTKMPQVPSRMTVLDAQIQGQLWTWDQSLGDAEQERYGSIDASFEKITKQKLDLAAGQIYVRKRRRIPLTLEGGGVQSTLNLVYSLESDSEKKFVYGVEEPESHNHFEFQRQTYTVLQNLAEKNQIIIATHSPIFVDRTNQQDTWLIRYNGSASTVGRISTLKEILDEVGARPSDLLFYANKLLFVEGKSDETILRAYAEVAGLDLTDVLMVSLGGKSKVEKNLRGWIGITRGTLPLYVVLDADAKEEGDNILREGLISRNKLFIWTRGSIESYYPLPATETALKTLSDRYGLNLNVAQLMDSIKKGLDPTKVELGEKEKLLDITWEVLLANEIAEYVIKEKSEVPDEVAEVLGNILDESQ